MKHLLALFIVIFCIIPVYASDLYHDYQVDMNRRLKAVIGDRESFSPDELPKPDHVTDNIHEEVIAGKSDDVELFLNMSSMLTDTLFYIGKKEFYRSNLDSIAAWWDRNESVISPDFMKDIMWTFTYVYQGYEFMLCSDMQASSSKRLNQRVAARHEKPSRDIAPLYNKLFPASNDWKETLLKAQAQLHTLFTGSTIIESIIPTALQSIYVYVTRRLMSGDEYEPFTPVTRKDFEDMRDWWFVNSRMVDNSLIEKLWSDWPLKRSCI